MHRAVACQKSPSTLCFIVMAATTKKIQDNLRRIREAIGEACQRSRREPDRVSIVAVTKSVDIDTVKNLIDAGLTELGENRTKRLDEQARAIAAYLRRRRTEPPGPVRWHMVGHLQRNKVRHVLPVVDVIHSVDSLRLAEEINVRSERLDRTTDVFLQVNCTDERQKSGCAVGAAIHMAELICTLGNLRLLGLMTMGPTSGGAEAGRPAFVRLRELFEEIRSEKIGGQDCGHLSMGMSQDYVVAVEEGATILRIGRALFQ